MDPFWELFTTQGRANRAWYFWHILLDDLAVAVLLAFLIVATIILETPLLIPPMIGVLVGGIWAGAAITVKRLHDLDRPWWHLFGFMIPLYNIYLGLVCLFQRGTIGPNRYGLDPLGGPDQVLLLEEQAGPIY